MSEVTDGTGRDDDAVATAAEYALELLPPREREAAARRAETDGRFRRLVAEWHEDFAALADEVEPATPPGRVRRAVKRFAAAETRGRRRRLGGRLAAGGLGWLAGGLAAAASALVILSVALPVVEPPYSGPFYEARLTSDTSDAVVTARFDPRDNVLALDRGGVTAPEGRVLQLWLLPEGADAPLSLGLLPQDPTMVDVQLPEDIGSAIPGGLLEISEEPPGGSPTGGPTGSVLAVGEVEDA